MVEIERYIGKYLSMLIHSYNPDRYVKLMETRWRGYVKFVAITLTIALCVFVLTFIPVAVKWIGGLPATLEEVNTFTITTNVSTDHPVQLMESPLVILDLNHETSENARVVLTNEGVRYPSHLFFGSDFARWEDIQDLKQPTQTRDDLLFGIVVFLLPSILFWVAVWSVVKLLAVFLFLVILGYSIPRFFKHRMHFSETLKTAVLAMPSLTLLGVGLSPLAPGPLWWWGLFLTMGIFTIGVFLLSERVGKRKV